MKEMHNALPGSNSDPMDHMAFDKRDHIVPDVGLLLMCNPTDVQGAPRLPSLFHRDLTSEFLAGNCVLACMHLAYVSQISCKIANTAEPTCDS